MVHRRVSNVPLGQIISRITRTEISHWGALFTAFLAATSARVSVAEKGIPAEVRGLGGCKNWERTSREAWGGGSC